MADLIKALMKRDWICEDAAEDDLREARKLLSLCVEWLPHGFLRDTIRQVSEGRSPAEAWRALRDMGGVGDG